MPKRGSEGLECMYAILWIERTRQDPCQDKLDKNSEKSTGFHGDLDKNSFGEMMGQSPDAVASQMIGQMRL